MKKVYIYLLAVTPLLWLATSCKSTKPTVLTKIKTEKVIETVHDTVFEVKADSSTYKALLECVNGKVVIKEVLQNKPGKNLKPPNVNLHDNQLSVDCLAEAQKLVASWTSKNTLTTLTEQTPIYIEFEPNWWQNFLMSIGKMALVFSIIWFLVWIVKKQLAAYSLKK